VFMVYGLGGVEFRVRVYGLGLWVMGYGLWVWGYGFRVQSSGLRV